MPKLYMPDALLAAVVCYCNGGNVHEVGEVLGTCGPTAARVLKRLGVRLRPSGTPKGGVKDRRQERGD